MFAFWKKSVHYCHEGLKTEIDFYDLKIEQNFISSLRSLSSYLYLVKLCMADTNTILHYEILFNSVFAFKISRSTCFNLEINAVKMKLTILISTPIFRFRLNN